MQIQRYNEIDLIRQTLAGDTSAFDRLVKTHRATVYVLVLSYTKNPADAEDLTQRIFIRAYERLATLRELDRFLPWLQRITHNACKDWIRRQSDSMTSFEEMNHADFMETVPTPEEIALKREIEAVVREAIGALKETDRKLVESGLSYAAIANRLKRAKQQMRRRIEKLLGGMAVLLGRTFIWGGIETVKLSVKTKLAAFGVIALIGIGGGALYHHTFKSNPVSESQPAVVNEQGVSEPEEVTEDGSTVGSPKPPSQADIEAAIAALENLGATERRNKGVESSGVDSRADSLTDNTELQEASETLAPEVELKVKRYAKLAEILPNVKELADRKFQLTKQNENYIEEYNRQYILYLSGEGPHPESDPDAVEEKYQATVKIIDEEVSDYYRQIGDMFPELDATYEVQGFDNMILLLDREVLREYFGRKLPWDGNPDYFSSQ